LPSDEQGIPKVRLISLVLLLSLTACSSDAGSPANGFVWQSLRVTTVADQLNQPWGMAFLPDGRLLVTEKPGQLRIVDSTGQKSEPIKGVPPVYANGQGGLLDVALDPEFQTSRYVYLSYSEPRENVSGTSVARGRLSTAGDALTDVAVIFRQQPAKAGSGHYGSRLTFARDGRLFVTLGERQQFRDEAQNLESDLGKVVRIESDGKVPADNPFVGKQGVRPEIWSYGHRNVQGAAIHPQTGELWTDEHGPKGGDELNVTRAGRNYGWPVITYGREYSGGKVSDSTSKPGMEQPVHYWVPSIAASGLLFYTGDVFPKWRGNAFVGDMKNGSVARLELDGEKVVREERLLEGKLNTRVRDIEQGPDGAIYLLVGDGEGRLLRLEPAG
jgi:glucose/arabinose dehydrogenase